MRAPAMPTTLWNSFRHHIICIMCVSYYNRSEICGTLFRRSAGGEKNYITREPVECFSSTRDGKKITSPVRKSSKCRLYYYYNIFIG